MAQVYSDSFLDQKRQRADPLADRVIEEIAERHDLAAVNDAMKAMVKYHGWPEDMPFELKPYLEEVQLPADVDMARLRAGERIFENYGPEILMILGFYSLPSAYAAAKGVQVLHRTGYLSHQPNRRLFETTQMVIDVMREGGLSTEGWGLSSCQKVRLMHAMVRYLILSDTSKPWDTEKLGIPINQEDLAATLMTFSFIVIDGLHRLGVNLSEQEAGDYFYAWQVVGQLMGVDGDMIPSNLEDARELTRVIYERQIASSKEGEEMTSALIEGFEELVPQLLGGLSVSLIDFFLRKDLFGERNIAQMLGVPRPNWTMIIPHGISALGGALHTLSQNQEASWVIRILSRNFVQGFLDVERGGERPPFALPTSLQSAWQV